MSNISKVRIKRLTKEYRDITEKPIGDYVTVRVDPNDLGVWYFLYRTDDGEFIFKIKHADNYPFSPPDLSVLTPNGVIDTGCLICTTFSSFHKGDWDASMITEKIIIGLISYFHSAKEGESGMRGIGVNVQSPEKRKKFAQDSVNFNKTYLQKEIRVLFYPDEPTV